MSDYLGSPLGAFLVALLVSGVFAIPIYRLLIKLKSRQTVSQYAPEGHQVKQGTPTMGGLIVLVGLVAALIFICFPTDGELTSRICLVALVIAFATIGFVDDFVVPRMFKGKRGLGWKQKIIMQFAAAFLAVPALKLEFTATNCVIAIFGVLFFSNAYNFADGLDWLAGSLGLLLFIGVGYLSAPMQYQGFLVCAGVLGAFLPFLFLNFPPAKVFMGDVGSLPIGALLGVLILQIGTRTLPPGPGQIEAYISHSIALKQTFVATPGIWIPLIILSLVMIAELVPVPMQIFWVKVFKKRLFPYTPIHHAFEKAGWKERSVLILFCAVQAVCLILAIVTSNMMKPAEGVTASRMASGLHVSR